MYASDPAPLRAEGSAVLGIRTAPRPLPDDPFLARIGESPLVPLRRIVPAGSRFELFGKAEFLNPTGSVKDRPALAIVRAAVESGALADGRRLLDATSGNTGLSLAMIGARVGIPVTLCLPRNAHPERLAALRAYGAELVLTDPGEGTDGAQREAHRLAAAEPSRYHLTDQYNNAANPAAHFASTGPEIWRQTAGRVTHLVAGVGTGGTVSGTGRYLKERNPRIQVVAVEPTGPVHGIEGLKHLPTARRPSTYDEAVVDRTVRVETETADRIRRRLALEEGFLVGMSAGAATAAALEVGLAAPGACVVAILPDGGHRSAEVE